MCGQLVRTTALGVFAALICGATPLGSAETVGSWNTPKSDNGSTVWATCEARGRPAMVRVGQGDQIAFRLIGEEYRRLDQVQVVQGQRRSTEVTAIFAGLGPWIDGGRDLYVTPGPGAKPGPFYRVEGLTLGKTTVVIPLRVEVTRSTTSAFARAPTNIALTMTTRERTPGSGSATTTIVRDRSLAPKRTLSRDRRATQVRTATQRRRTGQDRTMSRDRRTGEFTAEVDRQSSQQMAGVNSSIALMREGLVSREVPGLRLRSAARFTAPATQMVVAAQTMGRRESQDPMLDRAQRMGLLPDACSVHVYLGPTQENTTNPPTAFNQIVPDSPATTGDTLEIHGAYIPAVDLFLGSTALEVIEATPSLLRAVLPNAPSSGALRAVRQADGAEAVLEDNYWVVDVSVPSPFDLMDTDAISQSLLNTYLMALAANFVYPNLPEEDALDDYRARIEAQFGNWGLELITAFDEGGYVSGTLGSDTQGMMLENDDLLLIAFAGTQGDVNVLDYITDAAFRLVPPPASWGKDIFVHRGFLRAADARLSDGSELYGRILSEAKDARTAGKEIWITGHSLGGALAQIVAYRLQHVHDVEVRRVVTFGSPRVGNPKWARAFEAELGGRGERWVNFNDPVAALPPILAAYEHPLPLFNLDANGQVDASGDEMPYAWGFATPSHLVEAHMCYFELLHDLFIASPESSGLQAWPEMETCPTS